MDNAEISYVDGRISGEISGGLTITGGFTIPISGTPVPLYDGAYEVTPLVDTETVMETTGKRMEDDVTVHAIPYFETTNESGGYTVIIG